MKPVDAVLTAAIKRETVSGWCRHLREGKLKIESPGYSCSHPKMKDPILSVGDEPCSKENWAVCPFNRRSNFYKLHRGIRDHA